MSDYSVNWPAWMQVPTWVDDFSDQTFAANYALSDTACTDGEGNYGASGTLSANGNRYFVFGGTGSTLAEGKNAYLKVSGNPNNVTSATIGIVRNAFNTGNYGSFYAFVDSYTLTSGTLYLYGLSANGGTAKLPNIDSYNLAVYNLESAPGTVVDISSNGSTTRYDASFRIKSLHYDILTDAGVTTTIRNLVVGANGYFDATLTSIGDPSDYAGKQAIDFNVTAKNADSAINITLLDLGCSGGGRGLRIYGDSVYNISATDGGSINIDKLALRGNGYRYGNAEVNISGNVTITNAQLIFSKSQAIQFQLFENFSLSLSDGVTINSDLVLTAQDKTTGTGNDITLVVDGSTINGTVYLTGCGTIDGQNIGNNDTIYMGNISMTFINDTVVTGNVYGNNYNQNGRVSGASYIYGSQNMIFDGSVEIGGGTITLDGFRNGKNPRIQVQDNGNTTTSGIELKDTWNEAGHDFWLTYTGTLDGSYNATGNVLKYGRLTFNNYSGDFIASAETFGQLALAGNSHVDYQSSAEATHITVLNFDLTGGKDVSAMIDGSTVTTSSSVIGNVYITLDGDDSFADGNGDYILSTGFGDLSGAVYTVTDAGATTVYALGDEFLSGAYTCKILHDDTTNTLYINAETQSTVPVVYDEWPTAQGVSPTEGNMVSAASTGEVFYGADFGGNVVLVSTADTAYAGNDGADFDGSTWVMMTGGDFAELYAGSKDGNVTGSSNIYLKGGTVGDVYLGGNGGSVAGSGYLAVNMNASVTGTMDGSNVANGSTLSLRDAVITPASITNFDVIDFSADTYITVSGDFSGNGVLNFIAGGKTSAATANLTVSDPAFDASGIRAIVDIDDLMLSSGTGSVAIAAGNWSTLDKNIGAVIDGTTYFVAPGETLTVDNSTYTFNATAAGLTLDYDVALFPLADFENPTWNTAYYARNTNPNYNGSLTDNNALHVEGGVTHVAERIDYRPATALTQGNIYVFNSAGADGNVYVNITGAVNNTNAVFLGSVGPNYINPTGKAYVYFHDFAVVDTARNFRIFAGNGMCLESDLTLENIDGGTSQLEAYAYGNVYYTEGSSCISTAKVDVLQTAGTTTYTCIGYTFGGATTAMNYGSTDLPANGVINIAASDGGSINVTQLWLFARANSSGNIITVYGDSDITVDGGTGDDGITITQVYTGMGGVAGNSFNGNGSLTLSGNVTVGTFGGNPGVINGDVSFSINDGVTITNFRPWGFNDTVTVNGATDITMNGGLVTTQFSIYHGTYARNLGDVNYTLSGGTIACDAALGGSYSGSSANRSIIHGSVTATVEGGMTLGANIGITGHGASSFIGSEGRRFINDNLDTTQSGITFANVKATDALAAWGGTVYGAYQSYIDDEAIDRKSYLVFDNYAAAFNGYIVANGFDSVTFSGDSSMSFTNAVSLADVSVNFDLTGGRTTTAAVITSGNVDFINASDLSITVDARYGAGTFTLVSGADFSALSSLTVNGVAAAVGSSVSLTGVGDFTLNADGTFTIAGTNYGSDEITDPVSGVITGGVADMLSGTINNGAYSLNLTGTEITRNVYAAGRDTGAVAGPVDMTANAVAANQIFAGSLVTADGGTAAGDISLKIKGGEIQRSFAGSAVNGASASLTQGTTNLVISGAVDSSSANGSWNYGSGIVASNGQLDTAASVIVIDSDNGFVGNVIGAGRAEGSGTIATDTVDITVTSGSIASLASGGYIRNGGAVVVNEAVAVMGGSATTVFAGSILDNGGTATVNSSGLDVTGFVSSAVFGGSYIKTSGNASVIESTLNFTLDASPSNLECGIYGGGFVVGGTDAVGSVAISILAGSVAGSIFGGGYATAGSSVVSEAVITIAASATIDGDIYAGGYSRGDSTVEVGTTAIVFDGAGIFENTVYASGYGEGASVGSAMLKFNSYSGTFGGTVSGAFASWEITADSSVSFTDADFGSDLVNISGFDASEAVSSKHLVFDLDDEADFDLSQLRVNSEYELVSTGTLLEAGFAWNGSTQSLYLVGAGYVAEAGESIYKTLL